MWTEAIRSVLNESGEIRGGGTRREVELTGGGGHTVTICDLPRGSAVIDMEGVDHPGCVRPGASRQKCDYLVFAETEAGPYAVLVELKKTLTEERRPLLQLLRSRPIARYLADLCAVSVGQERDLTVRYLLLAGRHSPVFSKQRIRSDPYRPYEIRTEGKAQIAVFVHERVSLRTVIVAGGAAAG